MYKSFVQSERIDKMTYFEATYGSGVEKDTVEKLDRGQGWRGSLFLEIGLVVAVRWLAGRL